MGYYTTYTYDANGNLNSIKDYKGDLLESVTYEASGDKKGWVKSITDKNGCTKSYTYETMKTTITEGTGNNARTTVEWYDNTYYPITIVDPYNRYTQITYNKYGSENIGEIMTYIDANGNKTQNEIDDRGNVKKITNPDGSIRFYTYDANDNLTSETDEEGNCTVYKYDHESKLTKKALYLKKITPGTAVTLNDDGSNASDFAITYYTYYTPANAPAYKAKGLLKEVIEPIGFKTTYTYTVDGNVETVTDNENNTTTYTYDLMRLKKSEQTPKGYITYYNYDKNGRLEISWNNVNDGKSRIVYDGRGRKVKEVSPKAYFSEYDYMDSHNYDPDDMDTKYYRYEYDDTARIKTVTDPCLNQTVYTYDIFGNLVTEENQTTWYTITTMINSTDLVRLR
jgi:YD repeat-containing protein